MIDSYKTITVEQDDNLWVIAEAYVAEHGLPLVDFVEWVENTNNLSSAQLKAGQEIIIPVKIEDKLYNKKGLQLASK